MSQYLHILVVELYPDLDSKQSLGYFRRNESEPINSLRMLKVLSQQEEHQIAIDGVRVLLSSVDGEDKTSSVLIFGIFPLGLYSSLEVFN